MSALTLTPRALYEEVAEQLRQRIFRRELEPGSWIDELKIAEEFGISRTPLREALKVLAAEGLVTMKVRRGAYVTEMSEKDLRDVYHLLSLLESDAAGVVATTATAVTAARRETWSLSDTPMPTVPAPDTLERRLMFKGVEWLSRYDMRPITGPVPHLWDGGGHSSLGARGGDGHDHVRRVSDKFLGNLRGSGRVALCDLADRGLGVDEQGRQVLVPAVAHSYAWLRAMIGFDVLESTISSSIVYVSISIVAKHPTRSNL